jgi:hypothetical protein
VIGGFIQQVVLETGAEIRVAVEQLKEDICVTSFAQISQSHQVTRRQQSQRRKDKEDKEGSLQMLLHDFCTESTWIICAALKLKVHMAVD